MDVLLQPCLSVVPIGVHQLNEIADRGFQFYKEGDIPGRFVPEVWHRNWVQLLNNGSGVLLGLQRDGQWSAAIGGVIYPDINDGDLVLMECFWFAFPEARGRALRLVRDFEDEGKLRGAKRVIMMHLLSINAEVLGRVYQRMGYRAVETHYIKDI